MYRLYSIVRDGIRIYTVYSWITPVKLDFQLMISFLTASEFGTGYRLVTLDQLKGISTTHIYMPVKYWAESDKSLVGATKSGFKYFLWKSIAKDLRFMTLCRLWLHLIIFWRDWTFQSERFWMKSPKIGPGICFGSLLQLFQVCLIGLKIILLR